MLLRLHESIILFDLASYVNSILLEGKEHKVPALLVHCVAEVADKFAKKPDAWLIAKKICLSRLNKLGYLQGIGLTAKGEKAEEEHLKEKEHDEKVLNYIKYYSKYQKYLKSKKSKSRKRKK
ncbi:MAG: hypothetical protein QW228_03135 [Candidatus Aenigmatarchaeota archaeon]